MPESATAPGPLDRLASFRVIYAGIFAYVVVALTTLFAAERLLDEHFQRRVDHLIRVNPAEGHVVPEIQERLHRLLRESRWIRLGGVRVTALVLGADGRTPIYLMGRVPSLAPRREPESPFDEAARLLPALATVSVTLPLDSLLAGVVWVGFGAILVSSLFVYYRSLARRDDAILRAAIAARDATVARTRSIQSELEKVRSRLDHLEPTEQAHAVEIGSLQREREALQAQLRQLAEREQSLRERAARSTELEEERRALEDLLEEAVQDLDQKEGEIHQLQESLKRASKGASPRGRGRAVEQLAKRLRTLYRNLEFDDRALADLAALGDESLRLRAEESLKKLDEGPDSAGTRRKVGGLPPQLAVFELGFAGKGRIYYSRGQQRACRILAVGGKASQKTDLEYLSRLTL
jgi:hypothetical protein